MNIPEIKCDADEKYHSFTFFKKGGMGEIYKGKTNKNGNDVILKLVLIDTPDEEKLLQTELKVSNNFKHNNIVNSLHTGKITIESNNYFYIIQEYYPNGNLRSIIKENLPFDDCYRMFNDILTGMKELHKSIVHRDLKPENILVKSDGTLVITDFGLAKYIDEKTRSRSSKGAGTIPYMAPECWTGDTNTIAMDIYALGIIFYEIITGRLPYSAKNEIEWRECHLFSPLPSIANNRGGNITKLDQIIQKMSNKRVNQRYSSIEEIVTAIGDAQKISKIESDEAERLAQYGNIAMQGQKSEELKRLQENQKKEEWAKFLNYEVNELFGRFKEKTDAINSRLEDIKITIRENKADASPTNRSLSITFRSKSINVNFMNHNYIDQHDIKSKQQSINFQKERYGLIFQNPGDTYFKKNSIVLIGLAEISFKIIDYEFGFNLFLKKIDDSNYGEWYIMQFSENITPPKTSFGINLSDFFEGFKQMEHSMFHSKIYRLLSDKDINDLLEKIMLP